MDLRLQEVLGSKTDVAAAVAVVVVGHSFVSV